MGVCIAGCKGGGMGGAVVEAMGDNWEGGCAMGGALPTP